MEDTKDTKDTKDERVIGHHGNFTKLNWCLMHAVESFMEAENTRWNAAVQQAMDILINMVDMKPTTQDFVFVLNKMALVESTKEQHLQPHPLPGEVQVLSSDYILPCQQLAKRPPNVEEPVKRLPRHAFEQLYVISSSEFRLAELKMKFEGINHTSDPKEIAFIRARTFSISLLDYFLLEGKLDETTIDRISTKIIGSVSSTGQEKAPQGKEWITELNQQSKKQFVENTRLYLLQDLNGAPSAIARGSSGQIEAVAVFFQASQTSFAKNVARFFSYMFGLSGAWIVLDTGNTLSYKFIQLDDKALQNIMKRINFYVNFISQLGLQKA